MAKTNNYYWWTPEKWADTICAAFPSNSTPERHSKLRDSMANMTHHERRLYIRKLLKDVKLFHYIRSLNVSPDSSL